MPNEVYMDIPAVRYIAITLNRVGDTLLSVSRNLESLVNILQRTAFVGAVSNNLAASWKETIEPYFRQMAMKCKELAIDVTDSVNAFERGDALGATRFY